MATARMGSWNTRPTHITARWCGDHGTAPEVPVIHDVAEHVRGIGPAAEALDLVDDENVAMGVGGEGVVEPTFLCSDSGSL